MATVTAPAGVVGRAGEERALRSAGTGASERSLRLDAVRGVAAGMVLCAHAALLSGLSRIGADGNVAGQLLSNLSSGIHLFFALSGFLIAGPFLRALVSGRRLPDRPGYFVRRAARILPAYWVAMAALILLVHPPAANRSGILVHTLLLQSEVPGQPQALYFVAWTLGVEAMFYLLVPLAALGIARLHRGRAISVDRLAAIVLGTWALSTTFSLVTATLATSPGGWHGPLRVGLPAMLSQFCPGMLLALALHAESIGDQGRLVRAYRALVARPIAVLAGAAALATSGVLANGASSPTLNDLHRLGFALAAGLVLVLVVNAGRWLDRPAALLARLGTISYGVYLWHWVVVQTLLRHRVRAGSGAGAGAVLTDIALVAAITLPVATASWLLVEHPAIRWAAGVARRLGIRTGAAAPGLPAAEAAVLPVAPAD